MALFRADLYIDLCLIRLVAKKTRYISERRFTMSKIIGIDLEPPTALWR
jgi:hypothetical protein